MPRQRRRNMRSVDVYPFGDTPLIREFTAGCATVAELYSLSLGRAPEPIKATVSWSRILVDPRVRPGAPSRITEEPPDGFGLSDGLRCLADPAILAADAALRPTRYLHWLHERMVELARARGWDQTVLDRAFADCVTADLRLVQTSKPKLSPDRRHRATVTRRMNPDGSGTLELAIVDRDAVPRGRTRATQTASGEDYARMARQLRWVSATEVATDDGHRSLGIPGIHRLTARVGADVEVESAVDGARFVEFARQLAGTDIDQWLGLGPCPEENSDTDTDTEVEVEYEYEPDVLPPRRLVLVGGGPVGAPYGISGRWHRTFRALLGDLDNRPEWRAWWEHQELPECLIQYYTDAPASRVRIRRTASKVQVWLERPKETTDPVAEARTDANAVIQALTRRFGLPPAPPLEATGP